MLILNAFSCFICKLFAILVNIWLSAHVAWGNMKFSADKSDHLGSRLPWRYGLLRIDDISRLAWNWLYLHCPLEKRPTWCTASDHLLSLLYPGVIGQFTGPIPLDGSSIPTCFRLNITRTQGCFFLHFFWISVLKFGKPLTCRVAAEAAKAAVFHHACKRTSWCRRSAIFGAS